MIHHYIFLIFLFLLLGAFVVFVMVKFAKEEKDIVPLKINLIPKIMNPVEITGVFTPTQTKTVVTEGTLVVNGVIITITDPEQIAALMPAVKAE